LGGGGATSSAETSEEPADEGTEASGPGAIPSEYPESGLTFANMPDVEEELLEALRAYVDYERGVRMALREAELNDLVRQNGADLEVQKVRQSVQYQVDNNIRYRGEVVIAFVERHRRSETVMQFETCVDGTGLWLEVGGERRPIDGGDRPSKRSISVTLGPDGWQVYSQERPEGRCEV
jgi:hypothetical protein